MLEILNLSTEHLQEKGFENARLNAERMLAHTLNLDRIELYLHFERPLTDGELAGYRALLKRRITHEPLQYILGETEFMSLPFKVDRRCLIPRPETEILVQTVIDECTAHFGGNSELSILDIGTGSGNIAVTLANYLPNARITGLDCSDKALAIAQENAFLNAVSNRIEWIQADAMQDDLHAKLGKSFHAIVSNPPYIPENEYNHLPAEIRDFEPKLALQAGDDGLAFYKAIAPKLSALLLDSGFFAFEIGKGQAHHIKELLSEVGISKTRKFTDLNNIYRFIVGKL
ncbi:peptide chain release factor N(5)-glutamine methyltransferase [candidate division KSB1 bacterium]|nr:peptide chain release factor N(5)-glutamine methyltransferase [candidate division KSB1 bacterium]